jgi:hypothetical protein
MSAATRAKTAKERASIASRLLMTVKNVENCRAFDDCFEMFDGAEVRRLIVERIKRNDSFKQRVMKVFNWPEVA